MLVFCQLQDRQCSSGGLRRDQKCKKMCVSAAGATPEMGLSHPAPVAGAPWVSSARARQLGAGYLLAEKFQNFICSCQVKTERMINGDQIKGGKKLTKYCNSSWWHFKLLFSVGSADSLPFYEHSALFGLYSQNREVLFVFLTGN